MLENGITAVSSKKIVDGSLGVSDGKLHFSLSGGVAFDLKGASIVYPGLINAHDHLQGNYLPPVGPKPGVFYLTGLPWDNDLKASVIFAERSKLSREDLYNLSAYKCLFSGVTTVNDHFPHILNHTILPTLPIRVIQEYSLSHEASSYDLKWGSSIESEHHWAVKNRWPFITHLSEGFDEESMRGVENLEKLGALDAHCLLVHCIGFSDEDIQKVARARASVAWCPASNMFMFNVTAKIRKFLKAGINVTLGTDSSATGSYNLLEEIQYARNLYRRLYGEDLPAKTIFEMITENAAKAFLMENRIGTLEEGKLADILILKGRVDDPFENLASASMEDIELVTLAGKPIYGEFRFLDLLGGRIPKAYHEITVGGRPMFISGDPAALYLSIRRKVGLKKVLDFLPFEPEGGHYA
ncbi:MAG: amidohydrolase family protein [Treponema sp.]|nr:amidohydrolase family protein [Treponema sp.]